MIEFFTDKNLSISLITLISLLVNAITIYKWIAEGKEKRRLNDQAFHMVMGLAHANSKRGSMIVKRLQVHERNENANDEAMIFLENMYSDTKSNIESLLAAAKALKPDEASNLPYDGDALLNTSREENAKIMAKAAELEAKIRQNQQTA